MPHDHSHAHHHHDHTPDNFGWTFGIATALFTFGFLYGWVKTHWFHAFIYTGVAVGLTLLMSRVLGLYWPEGILLG